LFAAHFSKRIAGEAMLPFTTYDPGASEMNDEQKLLYEQWEAELPKEAELESNFTYVLDYILCYSGDVHASKDMNFIYDRMRMLESMYKTNDRIRDYCADRATDALIGMGELDRALSKFRSLPLGSLESRRTDVLLSLKYRLGHRIAGKDVLTLCGRAFITKYAEEHWDSVAQIADAILQRQEARFGSVLSAWISENELWNVPFQIDRGTPHLRVEEDKPAKFSAEALKDANARDTSDDDSKGDHTEPLIHFGFSTNRSILKFCESLTREAENTFREERGIPKVGEGWVSETELYYKIKEAFPEWEVIHHGRPTWLGLQHLDIYIEEARIALEYQGEQHFKPHEYFGGEVKFHEVQKRDARKRKLCKKNGLELIYVEEGYLFEEVIARIKAAAAKAGS
jgi:hypothetical protein